MNTDARIAALEKRIHRLHTTLIALIAIGLAGACLAFKQAQPEELTVARLTVVDEKGTPRVVIGTDRPDMQRISPSTGITIHDTTGAERFGVGVMQDNRINMGFDAPVDVGSPMRDRIGIGVASDGSAYVMLIDNNTAVPVRLVADAKGGGGVEFLDYDKPNSKVTVKRHTFAGEKTQEYAHKFPADTAVPDKK